MTSWIPIPDGSDFTLANLPYGIATRDGRTFAVVAVGDHAVDLSVLAAAELLGELPPGIFDGPTLNPFLALGRPRWREVRSRLLELLTDGRDRVHRLQLDTRAVLAREDLRMRMPIAVGDYVDFYSSLHHATNVGRLFRPDADPLLPNWRHQPVGYHGRSGTVVVDGTPVRRPWGQRRGPDGVEFGPSRALDFELEVGFVTGTGNILGEPIPIDEAEEHVFGLLLVNDWSARDIQAWEYQPLGPFLGKSFATTVSPWLVPLDALAPYRVAAPPQDPEPLPYLRTRGPTAVDLRLQVEVVPRGAERGSVVTRVGFADMYWTIPQQLAHATINGASVRPGDLFASGTVSGPEPGTHGCLLEATRNGAEPLRLVDGSERRYLEDGDTVVLRGWAGEGEGRVGFGECRGQVVAALPPGRVAPAD